VRSAAAASALLVLLGSTARAETAPVPVRCTAPEGLALYRKIYDATPDPAKLFTDAACADHQLGRELVVSIKRPAAAADLNRLRSLPALAGRKSGIDCHEPQNKEWAAADCKLYVEWTRTPTPGEQRVRALVDKMTPQELFSVLSGDPKDGFSTQAVPRLGVPAMHMDDAHLGVAHMGPATAFPAAVGVAASFDPSLAKKEGAAIADEARARDIRMILGPDVNIQRLPVGGRNFEMLGGQEPVLTADMGAAFIRGTQEHGVIATAKHFILNDQELFALRTVADSRADERTIHEIYGLPFEAAVRAGVLSVMGAYNLADGTPSTDNNALMNGYLRDELGFDGLSVSDWASAIKSSVGAARAGTDLEMDHARFFGKDLADAWRDGLVSTDLIKTMVFHTLYAMERVGALDDKPGPIRPAPRQSPPAHVALARDAAEEGMVLLKNDGAALPLSAGALKSLALIGPDAAIYRAGGGSSYVTPTSAVTPLGGLTRRAGRVRMLFAPGVAIPGDWVKGPKPANDDDGIAAAVKTAAQADASVLFVGDLEAEDNDRKSMSLPGRQDELVAAVAAANRKAKKRTIVVLLTGSAVPMPWIDQVDAVLEAWYPGQQEGEALARVLFGDVNPSGKLPVVFPKSWDDASGASTYSGTAKTIEYSEKLLVGQRSLDKKGLSALFPFGHGLSYTTFGYSGLRVQAVSPEAWEPVVEVSFDLADTGPRAGAEVAQVYVGRDHPDAETPVKELKAFQRVALAAGGKQRVTLSLDSDAFRYWDATDHRWTIDRGVYHIFVGSSSQDVRLAGDVELK